MCVEIWQSDRTGFTSFLSSFPALSLLFFLITSLLKCKKDHPSHDCCKDWMRWFKKVHKLFFSVRGREIHILLENSEENFTKTKFTTTPSKTGINSGPEGTVLKNHCFPAIWFSQPPQEVRKTKCPHFADKKWSSEGLSGLPTQWGAKICGGFWLLIYYFSWAKLSIRHSLVQITAPPLIAAWLWVNEFTSLSQSFLICEMVRIIIHAL